MRLRSTDAYAGKGFEVMRAMRKGRAGAFNLTRDICGEARIVERAFGLSDCALSEAVRFLNKRLELEAACRNHASLRRLPNVSLLVDCNRAIKEAEGRCDLDAAVPPPWRSRPTSRRGR